MPRVLVLITAYDWWSIVVETRGGVGTVVDSGYRRKLDAEMAARRLRERIREIRLR